MPDWISVDARSTSVLSAKEASISINPDDADSLRRLATRIAETHGEPVRAVVESMTGARLVHDTLEAEGWDVEIADAPGASLLALLPRAFSRRSWSYAPGRKQTEVAGPTAGSRD